MDKNWYAVYTKPGKEKKIMELLTKKSFENYCPLNMIRGQRFGRKKIIFEPLFTSFVFVRSEEYEHAELKNINGIINLVYWLHKPAVITNDDIHTIRKFLHDFGNVHLEKTQIGVNDSGGNLSDSVMNQNGNIVSAHNDLVKVILPSLGYMMVSRAGKQNVKVIISKNSGNYTRSR
jgi:transcription antitermination factor NusG